MKSPDKVRDILRRRWENADSRLRLLLDGEAWPLEVAIGLPTASLLTGQTIEVKRHVERWREVERGEVVWGMRRYRGAADSVSLPTMLRLQGPAQWVDFCNDRTITAEYRKLTELIAGTDLIFHEVLVRRRSLWRHLAADDVLQACRIALEIKPGVAAGRPLRLLSEFGVDTKFFERQRGLLQALLDQRFDDEASQQGLESFLGARAESDRWLLVRDLDGGLVPFEQLRVRSGELRQRALPSSRVLIVENEACSHLMPMLPGTIAVMGGGFDVDWTEARWLADRKVGYWGDIDTWGLTFLAKVRRLLPEVEVLLMDTDVWERHAAKRVTESVRASDIVPSELTPDEQLLYRNLLTSECGRLEQEFIDPQVVNTELRRWAR